MPDPRNQSLQTLQHARPHVFGRVASLRGAQHCHRVCRQCSDDQGKSPERVQLQRSLQQRHQDCSMERRRQNPTASADFSSELAEGPRSGSVHCAMLLEFTGR